MVNHKLLCTNASEDNSFPEADGLPLQEGNDIADNIPLVTYQSQGHATPLNDWEDLFFFTAAFPTLFPFGTGGHLCGARKTSLSIQTWAKWALNHHSRR